MESKEEELLSVKDFSQRVSQTQQGVYKQLNNKLKDYVVIVGGKKKIKASALSLYGDFEPVEEIDKPVSTGEQLGYGVDKLVQILQDQLKQKDSYIETLTKQLEQKDKQIDDYSQRLQEAHSLHLVEKTDEVLSLVNKEPEVVIRESKVKSFFKRFSPQK